MISQICPQCNQLVQLPESSAGTLAPCPNCGKSVAVPGRYSPSVDLGAPPPGLVPPPTPVEKGVSAVADAVGSVPARGGVSLSPRFLAWAPAACLTLIVLLTFLAWVGLYPGGYEAYSQTPWRSLFGSVWSEPFAEDVLKLEAKLKAAVPHTFVVMLPYFVLLIAATVLAWADRIADAERPAALPGPVRVLAGIWPFRASVLASVSVALLALILIQSYAGFGLERGLHDVASQAAEAPFVAVPAEGTGGAAKTVTTTVSDEQKLRIKRGLEYGKYELHTTFWYGLALGTHVFLTAVTLLRLWVERRGNRPLPRLSWNF